MPSARPKGSIPNRFKSHFTCLLYKNPGRARTVAWSRFSCGIGPPPVQNWVRNGSRQVWVHTRRSEDFWRKAWCQWGEQRSRFSPVTTSKTSRSSAEGKGTGLLRTDWSKIILSDQLLFPIVGGIWKKACISLPTLQLDEQRLVQAPSGWPSTLPLT